MKNLKKTRDAMAFNIQALEALVDAGATAEMLLKAIKADHAASAGKRAKDAKRKRLSRASAGHSRTTADIADADQAVGAGTAPDPQSVVSGGAAENPEVDARSAQKERSPAPPKEKLHPKAQNLLFDEEAQEEVVEIARARPKRAATRLPDDWRPSSADLEFARTLLPGDGVQLEADKFRDHWHSSNGPPKRDWSAAWRNWCRNSVNFTSRNGSYGKSGVGGKGGFALGAVGGHGGFADHRE